MIGGSKVLGLIPARAGSKGLPGKNIRMLNGKPLIGWTIDAAIDSKVFDSLIVSTDSADIAGVASTYGVEVPFLRPDYLSGDTASSIDVVEHAINYLRSQGHNYDYLVLLEPTSPLREPSDIVNSLELMTKTGADSVVSVCMAETQHPKYMFRLGNDSGLVPYEGGLFSPLRRQEIDRLFFLEGTVYASSIDTLLSKRVFCHERTVGYVVPKWKSLEIDDMVDFVMVESIMQYREAGNELQ